MSMRRKRLSATGATLIEVLLSLLIIVIASIATLTYFGPTRGYIGKTGNRRAALERARERMEQLLAGKVDDLAPRDGNCYYCAAANCTRTPTNTWVAYACGTIPVADTITVEDQGALRRETTARFIDDPAAGTVDSSDVYELSTKVWFTKTTVNDDFNRIYIRTVRAPSE